MSDPPSFPQNATYAGVMPTEHVVIVVVFDGMELLDVAGPAEVFAEANRFGASYRLVVASVDVADVTTFIGTRFAVTARIDAVEFADTAIVSGGDELVGRPIDPVAPTLLVSLNLIE
jgi:transcriptional regulator GlxA family with amidase domain